MANLTEKLYVEMAGRIPASDVSDPPQRYNGFYYYEYRVPAGQFMVKARWKLRTNHCMDDYTPRLIIHVCLQCRACYHAKQ